MLSVRSFCLILFYFTRYNCRYRYCWCCVSEFCAHFLFIHMYFVCDWNERDEYLFPRKEHQKWKSFFHLSESVLISLSFPVFRFFLTFAVSLEICLTFDYGYHVNCTTIYSSETVYLVCSLLHEQCWSVFRSYFVKW